MHKSYHLCDLSEVVYVVGKYPYYRKHYAVHDHRHKRHHKRHKPRRKYRRGRQIPVGGIKTLFFIRLSIERAYDHHAVELVAGNLVDLVYLFLHLVELGLNKRQRNDKQYNYQPYRGSYHPCKRRQTVRIFDSHYCAAYSHDGRKHYKAQKQDRQHLYLRNIVGTSGDQRRYGKLVVFLACKIHYLRKYVKAQVSRYPRAYYRRKKSHSHRAYARRNAEKYHFPAVAPYHPNIGRTDAVVEQPRHITRQLQFAYRFPCQKQKRYNYQMPIFEIILEYSFHQYLLAA